MSEDFGSGASGPGGAGGLPYGYDNSGAHLRTVDAQGPVPHDNLGDRAAARLPKVAGAIVLILALAWIVKVFWPA